MGSRDHSAVGRISGPPAAAQDRRGFPCSPRIASAVYSFGGLTVTGHGVVDPRAGVQPWFSKMPRAIYATRHLKRCQSHYRARWQSWPWPLATCASLQRKPFPFPHPRAAAGAGVEKDEQPREGTGRSKDALTSLRWKVRPSSPALLISYSGQKGSAIEAPTPPRTSSSRGVLISSRAGDGGPRGPINSASPAYFPRIPLPETRGEPRRTPSNARDKNLNPAEISGTRWLLHPRGAPRIIPHTSGATSARVCANEEDSERLLCSAVPQLAAPRTPSPISFRFPHRRCHVANGIEPRGWASPTGSE